MQVYHRTSSAPAILASGFRDAEGHFGTDRLWHGVWLSDVPVDANDGAAGDVVLTLSIPEAVLAEWEWVEEGVKRYREFLVPAETVNRYGPPSVVEEQLPPPPGKDV